MMRNHFLHLALVCLAVTVNLAQAQLSAKAQENLINLANAEISKQIVNGSDNKSANQSAQTQQSFLKVVQAGQILNLLDTPSSKAQQVCGWLQKAELDAQNTVETIFYKAEALRLFKCKNAFATAVRSEVTKVLSSPETSVNTVNDYF